MNQLTRYTFIPLALIGATFVGCKVGPDYERPEIQETLPVEKLSFSEKQPATFDWWTRFDDPVLTDLLGRAYKNNRSLRSAVATLDILRAQRKAAYAALYPTLDGSGSYTRAHTSGNSRAGEWRGSDYQLGLDASWELDFLGGNRREIEAAIAEAEASGANLEYVWVSISGEIARAYMSLRTLQGRLAVAKSNLQAQSDTYELLASRFDSGIGDSLAKYQAEYFMQSTRSTIPSIEAQIVEVLNTIAVLLGETVDTLPEALVQAQEIPAGETLDFTDGIPADYLRQRPDVIAAERALAAATARIGSAKADRYPRFFINGTLGLESLSADDLLRKKSVLSSIGPVVTLPFFRGGQILANIEIKEAIQRQALANYEETLLKALAEVNIAMTTCVKERERYASLTNAVAAARSAYDVANDKFNNGLSDFNNVLDAQRSLLTYEEAQTIALGNIATAHIALYKALCGGWHDGRLPDPAAYDYFYGPQSFDSDMPLFYREESTPPAAPVPSSTSPTAQPADPLLSTFEPSPNTPNQAHTSTLLVWH